jgi:hypothetical protein
MERPTHVYTEQTGDFYRLLLLLVMKMMKKMMMIMMMIWGTS